MLVIDGHNLIGQLYDLSLSDPDDERKLVSRLEAYHRRWQVPVIVVFDPGRYPQERGLPGKGIKVLFAPRGSEADATIKDLIRRSPHPKSLMIVSSDREVQRVARSRRVRVMTSEEFGKELDRKPKSPTRSTPKIEETPPSPGEIEEWLSLFQGP